MTADERGLVMALATQGLPHEEFLGRFRSSTDGRHLCSDLLTEALQFKAPDGVEYALMVGYTFGFTNENLEALLGLVSEPWHFKHEDIVTALGQIKTPKAVEALYAATQWIPDYLDFDESRALAIKAIWALGRIDGPEADAALSKLTTDSDLILAEAATEQLRRRRSG